MDHGTCNKWWPTSLVLCPSDETMDGSLNWCNGYLCSCPSEADLILVFLTKYLSLESQLALKELKVSIQDGLVEINKVNFSLMLGYWRVSMNVPLGRLLGGVLAKWDSLSAFSFCSLGTCRLSIVWSLNMNLFALFRYQTIFGSLASKF